MTLYMIICTNTSGEPEIVFASTEYDAVFERRARITEIDMCREAHPIHSRKITV